MKALVLAAGFGTRLAPYTRTLPKPLFTLNGRTLLDLAIDRLLDCGCTRIFINTHHLAGRIRAHVLGHPRSDRLEIVHEPVILDTGGAMANLRDRLGDGDFLVVNADIVCDFDLNGLMADHQKAGALATLGVHDCPRFNKLKVVPEADGPARVVHFDEPAGSGLAFTGLQAVSPEIFDHMPDTPVFSSIEVYRRLCPEGRIRAVVGNQIYWRDIGTPEAYRQTARQFLAGRIFNLPVSRFNEMEIRPIAGDGSDREWFRATAPLPVDDDDGTALPSAVISDHGICLPKSPDTGSIQPEVSIAQPDALAQLKAFVAIGRHLGDRGLAVPGILGHDPLSGQVAVADLGGRHLADEVNSLSEQGDESGIIALYRQVIDSLFRFSRDGRCGFNPDWTCQTRDYSKDLILDLECRYFLNAFVKGYMGVDVSWETYREGFEYIADNALVHGFTGLMHRDCQSRNIMIHQDRPWFIDFQSARTGPLQYDLASLLIDPYVTLPGRVRTELLDHAVSRVKTFGVKTGEFCHSYTFCRLTRSLQMLGAFGFLTRVKRKTGFAAYMPAALTGLHQRLGALDKAPLEPLKKLVAQLAARMPSGLPTPK